VHESLFGRPAQEDPSSRGLGEAQGRPKSEAARTFGVSRSCVKPYAATRREGRPLSPRKHPKHPGSEPKLDERARKILQADVVEARPATTLKDRCRFLQEALGVWVSESTLSRLLRKMGFSPKDGACSRARTRRVLEGRLARPGLRQACAKRDGKRFVFVDECSSNTSLSPIYGWSRKGKRVCFETPRNWGTNLTLLSSMSVEGMGASMVVEGSRPRRPSSRPTRSESWLPY
jgi:transposase